MRLHLISLFRYTFLLLMLAHAASGWAQTPPAKAPGAVPLTQPAKPVGSAPAATQAASHEATPESAPPPKAKQLSSILPEGKTLPAETYRVRVPFRSVEGDSGFDDDGKKSPAGYRLQATGLGAVVEYGWTDHVSLQFLAPMVIKNELTFDKKAFLSRSDVIEGRSANKNAAIGAIAQRLTGLHPLCPTTADCVAAIADGRLANAPADLPLGSAGTIPSGAPILASLDAATEAGALARVNTDPEAGKTGLGDVQFGILWEVLSSGPVLASIGGGLRLPTGSFEDVDTSKQRPTGRGTTDIGLRWNLDLPVAGSLMFSWQNQSEMMLLKGKKKVGTTTADFERKGIRNIGFLKAAVAAAALSPSLEPLSLYGLYNYDVDGQERVDGVAAGARRNGRSLTWGLTLSGLEAGLPMSLDVEQERPFEHGTWGAKNIALATTSTNVTLKAYMRF